MQRLRTSIEIRFELSLFKFVLQEVKRITSKQ